MLTNLHIVLIMDYTNTNFTLNCESNPALYKQCAVQWMEGWSRDSMVKVSLPAGQPWFNCQWSWDSMVKVSVPTGQPWFNCQWSRDSMVKVSLPTGQPWFNSVESGQHGQGEFAYRSALV